MSSVKITFPDGSVSEYKAGITPMEIAENISKGLAKKVLAARVNGSIINLNDPIKEDTELKLLTFEDREGREVFWHSSSHIMAQAVTDLFPNAKLAIGPPIDEGWYYDFDVEKPFSDQDIEKIEQRMAEIIKEDHPFKRVELPLEEARKYYEERDAIYKEEILDEIEDDTVTLYQQDSFTDLCRGPHLPSTGKVKAFKLLSSSGAYWRGDERNKMLQRIYGVSYPSKKQLDEYLNMLEEAKKRDHRKLGRELDLFSINENIGSGLVLWHPKGAVIRNIIEEHWKKEHIDNGFQLVFTPHIARLKLWEISGHTGFYAENMFQPNEVEGDLYQIKPMNCPFHIEIYRSAIRSYRDLPIKYAELGTDYRYERSGVLHGLMRVRGFTMDDAHIFCTPEQLHQQILEVCQMSLRFLKMFGFEDYKIYLSTRPEKYVGEAERWETAQDSLAKALDELGLEYDMDEGGGAFYGPKIDIKIKDTIGRLWQCSTIQFDFNLPDRFGIYYIDRDNTQKRPYMVHRAILGSLERFFGVLIENYGGAFPLWLAPVQVKIMTITDNQNDYAKKIAEELKKHDIRCELDLRSEKIGFKVREAETSKTPYMFVIGQKEVDDNKVSVRHYGQVDLGSMNLEEIISRIKEEIENKYPRMKSGG
ncbi:MAG TPA: threonine--tRNA ligase [candidate division Zixibacteria bacterium]|mgnify:CR=1 FL=1|nr:threonine--tRNA ligase [candidate division Zixibacteria bacterium]